MTDTKTLSQIFDVEEVKPKFPVVEIQDTPITTPETEPSESQDILDDYNKTRVTLTRILSKTELALDEMIECARATEKGRDFEVVGQLAKTLVEVSDRILDVHKKMNEIRKKTEKEESKKVEIQQQNNVVFSGSPSDLLDMIKNKKK